MQDPKKSPKSRHLGAITHFVGLYLRNWGTYRQSEKKLVKQQYLLHMSSQYVELRFTSDWDRSSSLGHPCKFQRVSCLGSVTAWHSSSGRYPNFVALNRGRHLYLAGRPSRWHWPTFLVSIFSLPTHVLPWTSTSCPVKCSVLQLAVASCDLCLQD